MIEKLDMGVYPAEIKNKVYTGLRIDIFQVAEKLNEVIDAVNKKDTLYCSGTEVRTGWDFNEEPWCNCDLHKSGETTGGWTCPRHGQQL